MPIPRFELSITSKSSGGKLSQADRAYIKKQINAARRLLEPVPLIELSIAIVQDAAIASLHQQFMQIAGPTDVLTFELDHNCDGQVTGGEVVINIDEAIRQSVIRHIGLSDELLLYALHGMLHLCAFDDRTESAYKAMHQREDDILTTLGIGPIFRSKSAEMLNTPRPRVKPERRTGSRPSDRRVRSGER